MQLGLQELQSIAILAALIGYLVKAVLSWFKPNAKQDTDLALIRNDLNSALVRISDTHEAINNIKKDVKNDLYLLKENELGHVNDRLDVFNHRLDNVEKGLVRIETILDERLPAKK